ncbi:hypothetical protein [Planococcus salinarum]|uniref:hypothetical protein n=1 Tax=Planococcus salinarum TaxID=622695 RepID=UPI000E3C4E53|nr:hypothetical protein [Planococcus salinarum]TAA71702.1 hypothetical protein D2909_10260 [Planococcus salinarum]
MKIGTIINLILVMIIFAIFFFVIDPLFSSNRMAAYFIYMVIFLGMMYIMQKLEDRFEFFQKKMDGQLGVLLIIAIFVLPLFFSMV